MWRRPGDREYTTEMTRSRKLAVSAVNPASSAAAADDIMQIKVWLLGVSPMVWRRVLVHAA